MAVLPPALVTSLEKLTESTESIPDERKDLLREVAAEIRSKLSQPDSTVNVTVICTHNSRRSIIGQLWMQAACIWLGISRVSVYSGGTEATQFNPSAVTALKTMGFPIIQTDTVQSPSNPIYECKLTSEVCMKLFSKKFNDEINPKPFIAILVCDSAAEACPYVPGASKRFFVSFEDPKHSDGSEQESEEYLNCVRQIGRQVLFILQSIYAK